MSEGANKRRNGLVHLTNRRYVPAPYNSPRVADDESSCSGRAGKNVGRGEDPTMDQSGAYGLYLRDDDDEIAERAAMRFAAFLESEIAQTPSGHPDAGRLADQLRRLRVACRASPRSIA